MHQFSLFRQFVILLLFFGFESGYALQILPVKEEFVCEVYSPEDELPVELLDEARRMYFEAYMHPALHLEVPFKELGIDPNRFSSYEEYIGDMFQRDFGGYSGCDKGGVHYFQLRCKVDGSVVGVCVVLEKEVPGYYYIDHIGIHWKFRQQGLAGSLMKEMVECLDDFVEISLDTRVFNFPAQGFYEKWGFEKLAVHPCAVKQSTYFHYILRK